jgi:predicted nucleic acid-binding protein
MLLDTSGLLCYHSSAEAHHEDSVEFYEAANSLLTHSYVLAEFVALVHTRGLRRGLALAFVVALARNSGVETIWVDPDLHQAGMDLLQARLDKSYSLCDAVSFALMRMRGITDALTTDHHFEQEGFRRLLG